MASSVKSVGEFRLGQFPKRVIQREFSGAECPESVGFSGGDFRLVIETFNDAAGKQLPRLEVVEDQLTVCSQHPGYLLHRFDARPHCLSAPVVKELTRPNRRFVFPKLMKSFLEQISADGFQIVLNKIAQPKTLSRSEIVSTLE